mmetsp:Transcript_15175/g.24115  ORF Transcript_15175/g.24115 Transcript_15175/m.24115 type:complete len:204 (-) Transcript_15175:181-792(-)
MQVAGNSADAIPFTVVACYSCGANVNVQRPPGSHDFQFPCPFCRTVNKVEDAPKEVTVKVPSGHKAGDVVIFLSPEGVKMQAQVPPCARVGSTFVVQYREKQVAQAAAVLHLSEHVVCAKDLECAPEDGKECPICLEEFAIGENLSFLPCFHRFHTTCAKASLKESRRCPMCNHDFHIAAKEALKLLNEDENEKTPSCTCVMS